MDMYIYKYIGVLWIFTNLKWGLHVPLRREKNMKNIFWWVYRRVSSVSVTRNLFLEDAMLVKVKSRTPQRKFHL